MNVWSGSISVNSDRQLEGIHLVDPTSQWPCDISKTATLSLRSFVYPGLIPLYARAGPNLEVHSVDHATSHWLRGTLTAHIRLNRNEDDLEQPIQSPVGLLVRIDGPPTRTTGRVTTGLLIYGILTAHSYGHASRPPTPPQSSPTEPVPVNGPVGKVYRLKVYAAPLSDLLVSHAQSFPSPPFNTNEENFSMPAEFLPDINWPDPKRTRVANLFEVAAQHHRRVQQRGGEAVSQIMASSRPTSSSQNLQTLRVKREPEDDQPILPTLERLAAPRSRSVSIGAGLHRPASRLGARGPGTPVPPAGSSPADPPKRTTTPNPFLDPPSRRESQHTQPPSFLTTSTSESDLATPGSTPKTGDAIIAENKNLIIRTILTGMRLYGFHRSHPRSSSSAATSRQTPAGSGSAGGPDPIPPNTTPAPEALRAETPAQEAAVDDEDFKAMYHATYKAAAFALRKYLKDGIGGATPVLLEKAKAMTCIDEVLRLFCEDH